MRGGMQNAPARRCRYNGSSMPFQELVEAEGHLIDSHIMENIFDKVVEYHGRFEVEQFRIGKTNSEPSYLRLKVETPDEASLDRLLHELLSLGCAPADSSDAQLAAVERDRCAPEEFYSTTNHRTHVRHGQQWIEVENQRMDAMVVVVGGRAWCRRLRDLRSGDQIVVGLRGIRVIPESKERDRLSFAFMSNGISSERQVETAVRQTAELVRHAVGQKQKVLVVAGPVVVHTGGVAGLASLICGGLGKGGLPGNALGGHDGEALAGKSGRLSQGILYECVKAGIPFVLAGSLRDDGPLPDTITDMNAAQDAYAAQLQGAGLVLCLGTMLHSIATGNMLPGWVKIVCVDINPAVATKVSDRGTGQAVGIVADVGLFLHLLSKDLLSKALV